MAAKRNIDWKTAGAGKHPDTVIAWLYRTSRPAVARGRQVAAGVEEPPSRRYAVLVTESLLSTLKTAQAKIAKEWNDREPPSIPTMLYLMLTNTDSDTMVALFRKGFVEK